VLYTWFVPGVRFFKTEAGNEPAREYLRSLEKADRQVCGAMLRAVQDYGLDAPGVQKRQLEGKLWELKPDRHRLMYVMVAGPTMVVLHGCKKEGRKASKADLDVARKRMKQVLEQESMAKKSSKK
jgi:phage-related protein